MPRIATRLTASRAMPSLATVSQLRPGLSRAFSTPAIPKTWGHPATGPTFNPDHQTEFRPSQIESGGRGWWALSDIPGGTRLRRVSVADGSLVKFSSLAELEEAGWDIDDAVNYGIGHWKSQTAIYFLNPGTAMNHADRTREASIKYVHDEEDVMELWTTRDVKAGDEMFNACIAATDRTRIEPRPPRRPSADPCPRAGGGRPPRLRAVPVVRHAAARARQRAALAAQRGDREAVQVAAARVDAPSTSRSPSRLALDELSRAAQARALRSRPRASAPRHMTAHDCGRGASEAALLLSAAPVA